jgi:hypothetical protein
MSFLDKFERIFGRFAIPNLSLYLIIGQVFVLLTGMLRLIEPEKLLFAPFLVQAGEWWRIVSFMLVPAFPNSAMGYVFLAFYWYLFYLMGNALEQHWGTFRFNVFILTSYTLTVGLSFITPGAVVENAYILRLVLLAFAFLNPNFELLLIVVPVKIKWIAWFTWGTFVFSFVMSGLSTRLQIGAATVTFFLFFGAEIFRGGQQRQRARARQKAKEAEADEPRHMCHVCGKTDVSHPQLDFRYCSKCAGDQCYCPEHIQNHEHVVSADDAKAR